MTNISDCNNAQTADKLSNIHCARAYKSTTYGSIVVSKQPSNVKVRKVVFPLVYQIPQLRIAGRYPKQKSECQGKASQLTSMRGGKKLGVSGGCTGKAQTWSYSYCNITYAIVSHVVGRCNSNCVSAAASLLARWRSWGSRGAKGGKARLR